MTLTSHLMIITFHVTNQVTRTVALLLNNGHIYNLHNLHNFVFIHILKMALNYNIVTLANFSSYENTHVTKLMLFSGSSSSDR
jgi:hypothetical protein